MFLSAWYLLEGKRPLTRGWLSVRETNLLSYTRNLTDNNDNNNLGVGKCYKAVPIEMLKIYS